MSPEAQRIAIAKLCPNVVEWRDDEPYWKGAWSSVGEGNEYFAKFDPLNDLNAMHEAEATRIINDGVLYNRYQRYIQRLSGLNYGWHTTASQRAEAFLKTLNLWTDEQ